MRIREFHEVLVEIHIAGSVAIFEHRIRIDILPDLVGYHGVLVGTLPSSEGIFGKTQLKSVKHDGFRILNKGNRLAFFRMRGIDAQIVPKTLDQKERRLRFAHDDKDLFHLVARIVDKIEKVV